MVPVSRPSASKWSIRAFGTFWAFITKVGPVVVPVKSPNVGEWPLKASEPSWP